MPHMYVVVDDQMLMSYLEQSLLFLFKCFQTLSFFKMSTCIEATDVCNIRCQYGLL